MLKAHRRKGAVSLVLKALINEAKPRQIKSVYLASQLHAADFYQAQWFKTCGDVFKEVGIQRIIMELYLDA